MAPKVVLEIPDPLLATPALDDRQLCYSYAIARGETGVLTFEPYKSLILPFRAFRTASIARTSAEVLWAGFVSYCERGDFVGADMTRKFIQIGLTRSKRCANHRGGRKYGPDGQVLEQWSGMDVDGKKCEKDKASEVFKEYWRRCTSHTTYLSLKQQWTKAKMEYQKAGSTVEEATP